MSLNPGAGEIKEEGMLTLLVEAAAKQGKTKEVSRVLGRIWERVWTMRVT